MKSPYPDRNVVKTDAEARIFQGQIAKARNSTINCPRGILMYRGNNMLLSDPKGIIFAAMFVPNIDTIHVNADRNTANRVVPDQYLSSIAPSKSHGFHRSSPQELFIAAVARIPNDAERVTARGFVTNCDHWAPVFVLLHRAMSGWFVISVAVFPMPLLIAYMTNHPCPLVIFDLYTDPTLPLVFTMQNINKPNTAGRTIIDLNQKNARS